MSTNQQKEPLHSYEIPSRPWEVIGIDLCECNGKDYLITVDYLSNFFEVDKLDRKTAKGVIPKLKKHFARYGIPDKVVSDNGPPFSGKEFKQFAKAYEFKHVTSSPLYPKSNGKVENAVKTAKRLMRKAKHAECDAHIALLDYRNTPTEGVGMSPVQVMFGRRTRTLLPMAKKLLMPETKSRNNHHQYLLKNKAKQAKNYNKNAKDLKPLASGEIVRVAPTNKRQPWKRARVEAEEGIRSYRVQTEDGTSYRRNRVHLRETSEPFQEDVVEANGKWDRATINSDSQEYIRDSVGSGEKSHSAQTAGELKSPRAQDVNSEYTEKCIVPRNSVNENSVIVRDKLEYQTASGRTVKKPAYLQDFQT